MTPLMVVEIKWLTSPTEIQQQESIASVLLNLKELTPKKILEFDPSFVFDTFYKLL